MQLVFATHNAHKLAEVKQLVPAHIELLSLTDIGCTDEIEETGTTLEENAMIKAKYVYDNYGYSCFADDSGLEIDAINGEPGVYSARYAGPERDNEANIRKVWEQLKDKPSTAAQFRTVIAVCMNKKEWLCEGKVRGHMLFEKRGSLGFGYDPIFVPEGYSQTFAELGNEVKNKISHRAIATQEFLASLSPM
ncbi:MAG: non-canonical purine NTP diphosphatase [Flavobacteriaceae bacterium]|nr:non-canonical purine NTP diphosphatase [Flavobacteriaceae bacterium]